MNDFPSSSSLPLSVNEVITCLRYRWGVTYDMQLFVRKKRLYLQIMWGYLEQQSFPMDEEEYRDHINEILEVINRIGRANLVREWLSQIESKPRIGRALSLHLDADDRLAEFLI